MSVENEKTRDTCCRRRLDKAQGPMFTDELKFKLFQGDLSKKERKRGYNQAEILAKGFSKELNIPLCKVLERVKESDSQTEKDVYERFENMQEKFELTVLAKGFKHVLIIDDVITTGATLAACSNVLISNGIKVSVVCLAYRGLIH